MLSYKNHALDEFLCDVVDYATPNLKHGELIRTGKPENAKLTHFSENGSKEEMKANEELSHRVGVIRKAQKISRDLKDCSLHFNMKMSPLSVSYIYLFIYTSICLLYGIILLLILFIAITFTFIIILILLILLLILLTIDMDISSLYRKSYQYSRSYLSNIWISFIKQIFEI